MYTKITQSGGRRYLQLVEGYRTEDGKVRHRVVANLGRLDQLSDEKLDPLINGLNRALGRTENPAGKVGYDSARAFGDVFALQEVWNDLGLGRALSSALRSSRRKTDAEALIRTMVFNRLCAPDSKLGCLEWLETVAMPSVPERVTHQQLLRAMDALIDNVDAVDTALSRQMRPLIDRELSIVFYDLTTVRIHGESDLPEDLRRYGMNKDTGGIARQFVLGVVQTADGLPLMHTVHPGNVAETRTLQGMLSSVLARFPIQRVVLVADRGLLSVDNIAELTDMAAASARTLEFILAVPARRYAELAQTFDGLAFEDGRAESRFLGHRLVVAHDPVRAAEQGEARRRKISEMEAFADKLSAKLDAQDAGVSARGRRATDRGAFSRFQQAISEAELTRFIKADYHADMFSYTVNEDAVARAERFDGKLVLLTNVADLSAEEVIARYKSLADIERGFRVLKSDIEIAPVHHRLPDRIRAHAMICFLALVLYRVMRMRLKAKGNSASPTTALERLRRIQAHKATIGDRAFTGLSKTTPEQLDLFDALNVKRPA
jgi:hypothetical protein